MTTMTQYIQAREKNVKMVLTKIVAMVMTCVLVTVGLTGCGGTTGSAETGDVEIWPEVE